MKRTLSILVSGVLLLVLCTASISYYACLDVAQVIAQAEAEMAIAKKDEAKFLNIMVSISDFRQSDGEIWHNNHLYDVIGYKVVQDSVLVTVYHDEKEESIAILIGESFENSDDDRYTPYTGNHLVSKHKSVVNDGKWVCDRIMIPVSYPFRHAEFFAENVVEYVSVTTIAATGPPPEDHFLV